MNARDAKNHLVELLRRERHAMADFILALAQFDQEKRWRELEYASLFSFLRSGLGLSAGAAQYRKTAAELVQRHPEVEEALRQGKLCLSSIIELAKVLTPENAAEVLPRFFGLSRREAADVAVSIRPMENPPTREVVTGIRPASLLMGMPHLPASVGDAAPALVRPAEPAPARGGSVRELACAAGTPAPAPATKPSTIDPIDAEFVRLHLTVSRRLLAKLEAAKAALSHSRPAATSEEILETALDLLLAQRAKRKGIVEKPRATAATPARSETIPATVSGRSGRAPAAVASGRSSRASAAPRSGSNSITSCRAPWADHRPLRTFG